MGTRRAQVTFNGISGLAEDRYVNTFYFAAEDSPGNIRLALQDFYEGTQSSTISQLLSPKIARSADPPTVKVYDLADAEPRQPLIDDELDIQSAGSTQPLPSEVAVCLSFYGTRNLPRQRGRVYLGPFSNAIIDSTTTAPDSRVSTAAINVFTAAAKRLMDNASTTWVVHSGVTGTDWAVTAGWVDNAFDTQRRRGSKATARTLFT